MHTVDISNGSLTSVTVLLDGQQLLFRLSLIESPHPYKQGESVKYIAYVCSSPRVYITSFYSGGATGIGTNPDTVRPLPPEHVVLSTSPDDISRCSQQLKEEEAAIRASILSRKDEEIARLNSLPVFWCIGELDGRPINLHRGEAFSHGIDCAVIMRVTINCQRDDGSLARIFCEDFITSSAVYSARFISSYCGLFPNLDRAAAKQFLSKVRTIVANAKRGIITRLED